MAETTIPDYPRGITFEQVWAALMADKEQSRIDREQSKIDREQSIADREQSKIDRDFFKETREQFREIAQMQKETSRQMEKTDEKMKELQNNMGGLNNSFGQMAEHLVAPGITDRFNQLGFHFDSVLPGGQIIRDEQGKKIAEVDLILEKLCR